MKGDEREWKVSRWQVEVEKELWWWCWIDDRNTGRRGWVGCDFLTRCNGRLPLARSRT